MTKLSLRLLIALLALVIATSACGGSPTAPDPTQPGPPVVNPPPTAASWIVIDEVRPPSGSTVKYNYGGLSVLDDRVMVSYRWQIDGNIPGIVAIGLYLSEDCATVILGQPTGGVFGLSGSSTGNIRLAKETKVQKTACIIGRLERIDSSWKVLEVVFEVKKPHELFFEEKK